MPNKKSNKKSGIPFDKKKENSSYLAMPGKSQNNKFYLPLCFLFGFAFILYANSLFNQYAVDDGMMITNNQFTKKGFSGISDILTKESIVEGFGSQGNLVAGGRYRPLSHITFAKEYGLFGLNPFMGHLINILLYAFTCLLVYKLLKLLLPLGGKHWYLTIPFIATMLFIAHPLHTEVVANIKGRDEIMSLLGSFGTLYFILKYIQNSRPLNLLWASFVFFLALMSKENAITFVAIIPLTIYFFKNTSVKKNLLIIGCLLAASTIFLIIRTAVLGFLMNNNISSELLNNPFLEASKMQKYATIFYTWGKYILLLVFPHPLTHDYYPKQVPIVEMSNIMAIFPLIIFLILTVYAIMRIRKKDFIAYCILFFGITFSVSSNLFFPIGTFMNERFMFTPLLGFCLLIAFLIIEKLPVLIKINSFKILPGILIGILLVAYSIKTIGRNFDWKNDYILCITDVKVSANSARCNAAAGGKILEIAEKETNLINKRKMTLEAIKYLNKAISIYPNYTNSLLLLGKARIDLEDYKTAREVYEGILKINSKHYEATNNWLFCAQQSANHKDYAEAIISYQKLITIDSTNNSLYIYLAKVYEEANKIDSSIVVLNKLLLKDPKNMVAINELGVIYGQYIGNIDKSLEYILKAYSISPKDLAVLRNLGVIYYSKNEINKALDFFNKAYQVDSTNKEVCLNLAKIYEKINDKVNANKYNLKANKIN
jgi:tetratricopeptide (TPR) repeat protein